MLILCTFINFSRHGFKKFIILHYCSKAPLKPLLFITPLSSCKLPEPDCLFPSGIYGGMVTEESAKNRIMQSVLSSAFEPEFHVDCRNICAEFREDLQFRFSLGLSSLAERMLHHQRLTSGGGWAGAYVSPFFVDVVVLCRMLDTINMTTYDSTSRWTHVTLIGDTDCTHFRPVNSQCERKLGTTR